MRQTTAKFRVIDLTFKIKAIIKYFIFFMNSLFRNHLRKLAIKTLSWLDPTFFSNQVSIKISKDALNLAIPHSSIQHRSDIKATPSLTKSLLVDTETLVFDDDLFNFILDGLNTSQEVVKNIKNYCRSQNHTVFASQEELFSVIKNYFSSEVALNKDTIFSSAFSTSLAYYNDFLDNININTLAYNAKKKPNFDSVFWPDPTAKGRPRTIFDEYPFACENKFIDRTTPIGSAGSCFAMEIAHILQKEKFNYVITEPNANPTVGYKTLQISEYSNSCAAWGTIFNTPSIRQLVDRAFGIQETPKLLFSEKIDGETKYVDPFREAVVFDSIESYQQNYYEHLLAIREAFLKLKVFIITLGVNEVWFFKKDGSTISRFPAKVAPGMIGHKILSVEDNLKELNGFLKTVRSVNPDIKIIVSVSPVPLNATFRGDQYHVISANCHSKSTLRVVAEEFVKNNTGVFYLPSYETVMYTAESAWETDQRHVSRTAVRKVIQLFNRIFVKD